ncbi:MAG: hypothetical protein MK033_03400 [Candidatus Caenarcaniphilales bacterium]|nr:hypothetical protein [Candidatus Caenarcaniphilales bacterium]
MAVPPAGAAINPSIEHAKSEYFIELNQALLTDLENQMSEFLALDTDLARASAADIRVQISITKSLIGFWRNEASFWKSEIDENKKDISQTNKLAAGTG